MSPTPSPVDPLSASPAARGLTGHLQLTCAADSSGRSYLRSQSFRAPIHISKPHSDGNRLIVNVVNPTAGLLDGDRISIRVSVEPGAQLVLTAPSASRVHRMRDGCAVVEQGFEVAEGGSLECWPELFIPQAGARYRQVTTIDVARGGELLFFESLAPGRVASGERFAYLGLEWFADLRLEGRLIARERYRLGPDTPALNA